MAEPNDTDTDDTDDIPMVPFEDGDIVIDIGPLPTPEVDPDAEPAVGTRLGLRFVNGVLDLTSEGALKAWESRQRAAKGEKPAKKEKTAKDRQAKEKRESSQVGMRKATADDAARLKALRVPPAWKNVHLSEDPEADLQATGVDVKGRDQYKYSAAHSERAAAEKFARVKEFHKARPGILASVSNDLKSTDPETREAAAVLYLIDKTAFRVGSDDDTGADAKAFGATTLEASHVKVSGSKVSFSFIAKKGVLTEKVVEDKTLAKLLEPRVKAGGRLFETSDAQVRDYLHSIKGAEDFKVKDLRGWHGTATALREVKSRPVPKTPKEYKAARKEVAKIVAAHLGNTPTVALASYIDPAAFSRWKKVA